MRMAYELAKTVKVPLFCVHVAAAEGVEVLAEARREGYPFWAETCPHYLTHTADMEEQIGCWGRVNTAIKWAADRDRLWKGLGEGSITSMATDHSAFPLMSKQGGGGKHNNIWAGRSGIAGGLRHLLPVMMTHGVNTGRMSMEELVRVCCTNTAKTFSLYPRKGVILEGSDADLVLVDPEVETTVDTSFYRSPVEWTIYEGWKFKGDARVTVVRGQVMVEDGELVGSPGWGRYLPRGDQQGT
jgi:dihydropyrimidinase/dihydroorotase